MDGAVDVRARTWAREKKQGAIINAAAAERERKRGWGEGGGRDGERVSGDESKKQRHRGERGLEEKGWRVMKVKASDVSLPPCPTFHPLSVPVHPHGGCYPGDFLLMGRKRKSGDTRGTQDRKFWHISFPALPHVSLCNSHRHAGFCQNPLYHDHNRAAFRLLLLMLSQREEANT